MGKTKENTYAKVLRSIEDAWHLSQTCTATESALSIAEAVRMALQQRMTVNVWNCTFGSQITTTSWFERKSVVRYVTSTETVEVAFDQDNTAYVAIYDHTGKLLGTSIEDAKMVESLMVA